MTMGNRDTGIFGNSNSTGYAGNELKRQACFTQFDGFFATAAEYKGSPPFKRATTLPSAASFTSSLLISGWRMVWLALALPT